MGKTRPTCWMWRPRTRSRTPRHSCSWWWRGMQLCRFATEVSVQWIVVSLVLPVFEVSEHKIYTYSKYAFCSAVLHMNTLVVCAELSSSFTVFNFIIKHWTNKMSGLLSGEMPPCTVWKPDGSLPLSFLINLFFFFFFWDMPRLCLDDRELATKKVFLRSRTAFVLHFD